MSAQAFRNYLTSLFGQSRPVQGGSVSFGQGSANLQNSGPSLGVLQQQPVLPQAVPYSNYNPFDTDSQYGNFQPNRFYPGTYQQGISVQGKQDTRVPAPFPGAPAGAADNLPRKRSGGSGSYYANPGQRQADFSRTGRLGQNPFSI